MPKRYTRGAWLRLNADGLFVATLALIAGLFDIFAPDYRDLVQILGYVPLTYWMWNGLYVVGGLVMTIGFILQKPQEELFGRLLVVTGLAVEFVRVGTAFGWTSSLALSRGAFLLILLLFFGLRLSIFLSKRGLGVFLPGRHTEVSE